MKHVAAVLALLALAPGVALADTPGFEAPGSKPLWARPRSTRPLSVGRLILQGQLTLGYRFDERLRMDLTAPAQAFDSTYEQAGFGPLIDASFRPYTLSLNYSLRPQQALNPFVGVGYAFSIDTAAVGVLAGLDLNAKAAAGVTVRAGADYRFNDRWFLRGEASVTQSDLVIYAEGPTSSSKIVDEAMDPVSFALSVGYRF